MRIEIISKSCYNDYKIRGAENPNNNRRKGKNMKKYKINSAYPVNKRASKNGIKWEYNGKVEDWKARVEEYHSRKEKGWTKAVGIRVTDENGQVIYEEI